MRGLPAYCPSCGLIFEMKGVSLYNVRNVSFTDVTTNCPKCGGTARVGDGIYNADGPDVYLVDGPGLTRMLIQRLQGVLRKAQETAPDVHDFLAEVAEVSPEFSEALRKYDHFGISVLILLAAFVIKALTLNVNLDFNQLVDQAWHMSRGEDPNFHDLPQGHPPASDDARLFLTSGYQPKAQANRHRRRQALARSRKRAKRP